MYVCGDRKGLSLNMLTTWKTQETSVAPVASCQVEWLEWLASCVSHSLNPWFSFDGVFSCRILFIAIYPIETLKTQMMSSTGESKLTLLQAAQKLWGLGGVRAYYRGLGVSLLADGTNAVD